MNYYICHGPNAVHYLEAENTSCFGSGQPNIEEFTDEALAKKRAIELGYVFEEEEPEEEDEELEEELEEEEEEPEDELP